MSDFSYTVVDGRLICKNTTTNAVVSEKEALNELKFADEHVNKIYIQGNKLIIKNDALGYNLEINHFTQFFLSKYRNIISNIISEAKTNTGNIQSKKHKGKPIKKNNIVGKIGVSVAPLVLITMLTTNLVKKEEDINKYEKIEFEKIENMSKEIMKDINQEISENQNIRDKISVDYIDEYENSTQAMIPNVRFDIPDNSSDLEIKKIQEKFYEICLKVAK